MNQDIKERIKQIQNGIVPEGYKKTKVGIVPEEWEVKRLSEILRVRHGKNQKEIEVSDGKYPILGTGGVIGRTDNYIYDNESVLIGRKGTINKPFYVDKPFWTIDTLFYTEVNKEHSVKFLFYKFKSINWLRYNEASGVPSLTAKTISNILESIPSFFEQQRIASILETWDRAIELKEKLIQEKQTQKKGLMEKLLTGEVRLQGYKGAWVDVKIKDIGSLKGGSSFPEKYQNNKHGKYPFFKVSDMNIENNVKYLFDAKHYITEEIRDEIKAGVAQRNSIVFAKVGAAIFLERKRLLSSDSCIDNNMMALTVNENNDYQYIYYLLANMKLSKFANTGALPSLNSNDIYNIKCKIPVDYHEQKSIAKILTMVDREIQFLQRELSLLKQQKKGLMQLLLTGIIRV